MLQFVYHPGVTNDLDTPSLTYFSRMFDISFKSNNFNNCDNDVTNHEYELCYVVKMIRTTETEE